MLHKESDEAQRQLARQEGGEESSAESEEEGSEEEEGGREKEEQSKAGEKRLRNQFNFSERASQTLNNPYRVSE